MNKLTSICLYIFAYINTCIYFLRYLSILYEIKIRTLTSYYNKCKRTALLKTTRN